jgi:hypothetical protein
VIGKDVRAVNATGAMAQEKVYISSNGGFCRPLSLSTKLFNIYR